MTATAPPEPPDDLQDTADGTGMVVVPGHRPRSLGELDEVELAELAETYAPESDPCLDVTNKPRRPSVDR